MTPSAFIAIVTALRTLLAARHVLRYGPGGLVKALREGSVQHLGCCEGGPRAPAPVRHEELLVCPLDSDGRCAGGIAFWRGPGALDPRDVATLDSFRSVLAMASEISLFAPAYATADEAPLSRRELEIARLISQGLQSKEIATRLDTSVHTVRTQTRTIFGKLGVHTRAALTARILRSATP